MCYKTKLATQKVYPTIKACSNMSAGFVIIYTSARGLIKKLDMVALLITDPVSQLCKKRKKKK